MAIDPINEELVSFREAAKLYPRNRNGKRPHISQIYRHTTHGLQGVKLEWMQSGGRRATSKQAVARFFARLTAVAQGETPPIEVAGGNMSNVAIEKELDAAGL